MGLCVMRAPNHDATSTEVAPGFSLGVDLQFQVLFAGARKVMEAAGGTTVA